MPPITNGYFRPLLPVWGEAIIILKWPVRVRIHNIRTKVTNVSEQEQKQRPSEEKDRSLVTNIRDVLFEQTHVAKDCTRIAVEVHAQTFTFGGQPAILSTVRDLSKRKQAEDKRSG